MLESTASVLDIEGILHTAILQTSPQLLGALPLTSNDVAHIRDLVPDWTHSQKDGLDQLLQHGRATLSLFLITEARENYLEGRYWPAIHKRLGLPGARVEQQLGRALRDTLERYHLPHIDSDDGQQYVGSILLHAGLVSSSAQEFFQEIVLGAFWQHGLQDAFSVRSAFAGWRAEGFVVPSSGPPDHLVRDTASTARRLEQELSAVIQQLGDARAVLQAANDLYEARRQERQLLQASASYTSSIAHALSEALEEKAGITAQRSRELHDGARALGVLADEPSQSELSALVHALSERRERLLAQQNEAASRFPPAAEYAGGVTTPPPPLPLQRLNRPNQRFVLQGSAVSERTVQDLFDLLTAAQERGPGALPPGWPSDAWHDFLRREFSRFWQREGTQLKRQRRRETLRPFLVATYADAMWSLAVELPESWRQVPGLSLEQGGWSTSFTREGRLPLRLARGIVKIHFHGQSTAVDLDATGPLPGVFVIPDLVTPAFGESIRLQAELLRGESGTLFVPESWSPISGVADSERVAAPPGYKALLCDGEPLVLRDAAGREHRIVQPIMPRFALAGVQLPSSLTTPEPPIFVGHPPALLRTDLAAELPLTVAELWPLGRLDASDPSVTGAAPLPLRVSGPYRLRLYGPGETILQDLPFRYLKEVDSCVFSAGATALAPSGPGKPYTPTKITLGIHQATDAQILARPATVLTEDDHVSIVADPNARDLQLELHASGRVVPFRVHLPHALWSLGSRGKPPQPNSFGTNLLEISAQPSYEQSCIFLRLSRSVLQPRVDIQIAEGHPLHYPVPREGDVEIPLRDLGLAIANSKDGDLLTANVVTRQGEEVRFAVARVSRIAPEDHECAVCKDNPPQTSEEQAEWSRCCLSCDNLYHPRDDPMMYACKLRVWQQWGGLGRLRPTDFQRLRGAFYCAGWRGEYPGQPYTQDDAVRPGKRMRYRGVPAVVVGRRGGANGVAPGTARAGRVVSPSVLVPR